MLNYSIPPDTQEVWFHSNSISHVPAEYFKNLPNLGLILLRNNLILDLDDFSFVHVPTVVQIQLQYNKLTVIRKNIFAGLPNLGWLFLSRNEIHEIQLGSFKENSALMYVHLDHNSLASLSQCVFDEFNYPSLESLFIHGNPIQCTEALCWLLETDGHWIKLEHKDSIICAGPGALTGWTWNSLTADDMNCDTPGGTASEYLLVLLILHPSTVTSYESGYPCSVPIS